MRILSYNIHKGIGGRDRRYRLDRIIQVIERENPDVICLQEVDRNVRRSRFHNQPQLLAEYFHARERLFQVNVHLKIGGYGNLVLSRWKLRTRHQISLRLNRKKPRGAQLCVVETPEGPLHVVQFHLGLAEQERHWQIAHLLNHSAFRESATLPTLLIGDTNDWRNTLADGQLAAERFEQVTAPPSRFRSFPAAVPVGSLDKAFYRGELTITDARVAHSQLARDASDHLPLIVDLHVGRQVPVVGES